MLRETPEFSSYQRVYSAIWPAVEELILHLQEICIQYAVPLAVVDGKVRLLGRCEVVEHQEDVAGTGRGQDACNGAAAAV